LSTSSTSIRRGSSENRARRLEAQLRSDVQLLHAIGEGKLDELGTLFDRYNEDLRRYFTRMGVRSGEIDDVVQLTFMEILRAASAGRFDAERSSGRTWIFGVATIMLRRHRRSMARALARLAVWTGFLQSETQPPLTPAEAFENDETARRLAHALSQLSEKKREAFVLVSIEGFSGEEAARVLGIPVKTIWTRLHHARLELRQALASESELESEAP